MKNFLLYRVIPLLAIATVVAAYFLLQTETGKIKGQFKNLAEAVNKPQGEGNTSTAIKMFSLGNLLCENVHVNIKNFPYNENLSSETLVSLASRGRAYFESISITILDVETTVNNNEATSRCAAKIILNSPNYNINEIRNFKAELKKIDGTWKFEAFKEDEIIVK